MGGNKFRYSLRMVWDSFSLKAFFGYFMNLKMKLYVNKFKGIFGIVPGLFGIVLN